MQKEKHQKVAPKHRFKGPWDAMHKRNKRHEITCELPNNCAVACFIARAMDLTLTLPAHSSWQWSYVEEHTIDQRTQPADKQMYEYSNDEIVIRRNTFVVLSSVYF